MAFGSSAYNQTISNSSNPDGHDTPRGSTQGVIIGKFLPPHRGHDYLVNFAASFVDKLWIFVCSLPGDPIPGRLRATWMQALFPAASIIHIEEVNAAANRNQPGAHRIWAEAVMKHLDKKPDYVFASEEYGWDLATALGARFVPVDPSRDQFPISGTELRSKPFRHWHYLPDVVRPFFVREIMIEAPGCSPEQAEEIIQRAAMLLNTLYVPVYSRFYQGFAASAQHPLDDQTRNKAQAALIISLKRQARCFLLRSALEEYGSREFHHPADWLIRLHFGNGQVAASSAHEKFLAANPDNETLDLICNYGSAAHSIRDAALDRFKDWF